VSHCSCALPFPTVLTLRTWPTGRPPRCGIDAGPRHSSTGAPQSIDSIAMGAHASHVARMTVGGVGMRRGTSGPDAPDTTRGAGKRRRCCVPRAASAPCERCRRMATAPKSVLRASRDHMRPGFARLARGLPGGLPSSPQPLACGDGWGELSVGTRARCGKAPVGGFAGKVALFFLYSPLGEQTEVLR